MLTRLLSGAESEEGGSRTRCSSNVSRRKRVGGGDIDIEEGGDVMNCIVLYCIGIPSSLYDGHSKGWLLGSVGRLLFGSSRVLLVVWTRICPAGLSF